MSTLIVLLAIPLGLLVLILLAAALAHRLWHTERPWDERHQATTADGWPLRLHRYEGPVDEARPPVILCHGIAANARNVDLDDEHSLAAHLRDSGRDVWVVDLRGVGASARPQARSGRPAGWCFDVHPQVDLPALLACVAAQTGAVSCDWVGYSMGGLVAYAGFGSVADLPLALRRLVTIGSPVARRPRSAREHGIVGLLSRLVRRKRRVRQEWLSTALAWIAPVANRLLGGAIGVPGATAPLQIRRAMVDVVSDVSGGVAGQFRSWMDVGRFESRDGTVDYAAGMARLTAPALVIGGLKDRVAPPAAVRHGHDLLGSPAKQLHLVGREAGQRSDYGHMDLAFGVHAPAEVYPLVSDFLNRA